MKIISAKEFKKESSIYRFPFKALDDTSGGSNLGRVEWCVEPILGKKKKGRYYIEGLLVWAKQISDKRYSGKLFIIPCFSEAITGDSINREDYLNHVWYWGVCSDHKRSFIGAYPQNHHTMLEINVGSSISIDITFK